MSSISRSSRSWIPPSRNRPTSSSSFRPRIALPARRSRSRIGRSGGAPGQSRLDSIEDRSHGFLEPAEKAVPQRDGKQERSIPGSDLRPELRRRAGDERGPLVERREPVVTPRDDPLGEDHQRATRLDQQLDCGLDRCAVEPFPVDAERPHPPQEPGLEPAAHEQMPARHHVDRRSRLGPEHADDHRVARTAMVRRDARMLARSRTAARRGARFTSSTRSIPQTLERYGRKKGRNTVGQNVQRTGGTNL